MKRSAMFSAILILSVAAAPAQSGTSSRRFSNPLLNDVARMTKAGVPDATIVTYVEARRARIDFVSADDMIQLRRTGVGETVIQYLAGMMALAEGRSEEARQGDLSYDSGDGAAYAVEPIYGGISAYPYGSGYWPYRFSASVFIGRRPFVGHGFFFRRPFIHHRAFVRHPFFFRRPFVRHPFFFRRPFVHHRVVFRHPVGRRSFFGVRRR